MSNFIGLRHVGWGVKDPVALAAFYRDVMGMKVVAQTPANSPIGGSVFLGYHPEEEHHDIVFFPNPMFAHTAFRVPSLDDLLAFYRQVKERGVPIRMALNHGVQLSLYISDPEGHMIEIYWATNIRDPRNVYAQPINLDLPEEELLREVERVSGQRPGSATASNENSKTMSSFIGLRQVGWGAKDPVALAAFYRDVMGMKVVSQSPANTPMGVTVFLSHHPGGEEHHDLVFFSNPMFAYTGFRVESLEELLRFYREVKERGIAIKMTFNHGAALSFYIDDPDGHMIEIYWLTNVRVPEDFPGQPLNLDQPEEELQREVQRMAEQFGQRAPSTPN